jgi:phosphatidylserine decarboxylase
MTIARDGWRYILALMGLGALAVLRFPWVGLLLIVLGAFTAFFFRDPERSIPADPGLIVSPADGKVISTVSYNKGAFLPAFDDKASLRNEQNTLTLEDGAARLVFKQIAGLIARRIVCWKRPGETVTRGERVGLIKFGSRVDVFVPAGTEIRVKVGERVAGGSSVIGRFAPTEP